MKAAAIALAFAIAAGSAQAGIVNYECDLHSMEAQGWIPPVVLLSIDADGKRARAYDGAIRANNETKGLNLRQPMDTCVKFTRKGEYRMQWSINVTARKTRVSYTATLDPKTNKLQMIARFPQVNALNRPSGIGSCKPVSEPSLF